MAKWKWYVYQFFDGSSCVYVGKGSGSRLAAQRRRFSGYKGHAVAYFKHEADALAYEKVLILELAPPFNKAMVPENAKPWTKTLLPEDKDWHAWCDAIGTRAMAARLSLKYWWLIEPSKIERFRQVAYG